MTPEQLLASRLVEQHDLAPPVDIAGLLSEYAVVERVSWPFDCDALTVGLTSSTKPRVFLHDSGRFLRERFTLAHELGHVLLPWHFDLIACTPGVSMESFGGSLREREASSFASCVMLPDRYLLPIVENTHDVAAWLEAVAAAQLSASAGLIGLASRALPPGIAFVLPSEARLIVSRGTIRTLPFDASTYHEVWGNAAIESGRERQHQGHVVDWYKLFQSEHPEEVPDGRDARQLLRDAVAGVTDDPIERAHIIQSVNGVIGANLKRELRSTPRLAYSNLRYRFEHRPQLADLVDEPDFARFLQRKISELTE